MYPYRTPRTGHGCIDGASLLIPLEVDWPVNAGQPGWLFAIRGTDYPPVQAWCRPNPFARVFRRFPAATPDEKPTFVPGRLGQRTSVCSGGEARQRDGSRWRASTWGKKVYLLCCTTRLACCESYRPAGLYGRKWRGVVPTVDTAEMVVVTMQRVQLGVAQLFFLLFFMINFFWGSSHRVILGRSGIILLGSQRDP